MGQGNPRVWDAVEGSEDPNKKYHNVEISYRRETAMQKDADSKQMNENCQRLKRISQGQSLPRNKQ